MNDFADGIDLVRPPHDEPDRTEPVPARIVTEWAPGTFIENLTPHRAGGVLVSNVSDRTIEHVADDGTTSTVAAFEVEPTGLCSVGEAVFANVGSPGISGWTVVEIDDAGRIATVAELPDALFLNGLCALDQHDLLAVDSIRGVVYRIERATGATSTWLRDERLTKSTAEPMLPGVNGIQVSRDRVHLTSTDRSLVLTAPIVDGEPGLLSTRATALVADDFVVLNDDSLLLTTHVYNQVLHLGPDGQRTVIAGPDEHVHGATSCALIDDQLLVTTTGGILAPVDGTVRTAKLVALDLSSSLLRA